MVYLILLLKMIIPCFLFHMVTTSKFCSLPDFFSCRGSDCTFYDSYMGQFCLYALFHSLFSFPSWTHSVCVVHCFCLSLLLYHIILFIITVNNGCANVSPYIAVVIAIFDSECVTVMNDCNSLILFIWHILSYYYYYYFLDCLIVTFIRLNIWIHSWINYTIITAF